MQQTQSRSGFDGPPPPGPRPTPFVFPFAEARALLATYERLAEQLESMRSVHDDQLDACFPAGRPRFEGARAREFLDGVVEQMRLSGLELRDVAEAIEHLRQLIAAAEVQWETWREADRRWTTHALRYERAFDRYVRDNLEGRFGRGAPPEPPATDPLPAALVEAGP